jgi:hypothetical protein
MRGPSRQPQEQKPVEVTPEVLDDALTLLRHEEASVERGHGRFAWELLRNLAVGIVFLTLPLGAWSVWFDRSWGIALLAIAGIAFFSTALIPHTTLADVTRKLRATADPQIVSSARELRARQTRLEALLMFPVFLAVGGALGFGMVYFALHIAFDGEVSIIALAAAAVATFVFWVWFSIQSYREYRYFSHVSAARGRLERLAAAPEPEDGTVTLESSDVQALTQAETKHVKRTVKEAAANLPDLLENAWAVSIAPEAQKSLDKLAQDNPDDWGRVVDAIQSLQFDPTPSEAYELGTGREGSLECRVDEAEHRVYVLKVGGEDGADA